MRPVLHLGPFTTPVAPLTWIAAFFVLQDIGERAARRLKVPDEVFSGTLTWTVVVGIIASRLAYIARYLDAYIADPLQIVALNFGTLELTTGALFGVIAGVAYLQRKKISLRLYADALGPALALAFAVVSFGNLLTGDAYGVPATKKSAKRPRLRKLSNSSKTRKPRKPRFKNSPIKFPRSLCRLFWVLPC